jgi:molecular chaperone DnaK
MANLFAIDFGTYRCTMAWMGPEGPTVIVGPDGEPSIPSVVAFTDDGVIVGREALEQAADNPETTVFSVKRLLGRKLQSPEVQWLQGSYPYPVVAAANGDAHIHIAGRDYSPEEIVSYLLEHLRRVAEERLGGAVEAVIAVPSFMDELGRRALLSAAKLAGLRVKSLMSATSATAIMCGVGDPRKVAVLDVGAGGFDVSLLSTDPKGLTVLANTGDPLLGGDDVDRRMAAEWLAAQAERTGHDLSGDPVVVQWTLRRAQSVKHELSYRTKTEAVLQPVVTSTGDKVAIQVPEMTRDDLADLVVDDMARLLEPCNWAFEDAQLKPKRIKAVYVVGGMARMPAVQDAVEVLFSKTPMTLGNADHIVALGAARHGASLVSGGEGPALREVLGGTVGLKVSGGRFEPVVRRNQPTPCQESRVFRTARADQDRIVFEVFQGECELAADNAYVGRFVVDSLRNQRQFETLFRIDRNGLLHVAFVDGRTGIRKDAKLQFAGGLTDQELTKLRQARAQRRRKRPTADVMRTPAHDRGPRTLTPRPESVLRSKAPQTRPFTTDAEQAEGAGPLEMEDDSLIGSVLDGRYVVEEILGEGGMGRVYKARHQVLDKFFAIKVLHPELAASRVLADRFIEEARSASSIKSPHVIDISDFGALDDGTGYFVMEYLEGKSLRQVLGDKGPLNEQTIAAIGSQVAVGLGRAHRLKVTHRDLKPANVMVLREEGQVRCVILDFGIAKRPTSDSRRAVTRAGVRVGTPEYMAPEQIDDRAVDGRTDIYALGVMLYEMAAGRRPFVAESNAELLMSQMYEPPPPIGEINPRADCSPVLEAIIRRCLEKEPDARYSSAIDLANELATLDE